MHCDNIDKTAGWQLADVSRDNEADIHPVLIEVVVFNALAQPTKMIIWLLSSTYQGVTLS